MKMFTILWMGLILLVTIIGAVRAYEINSTSYEADSYHYGLTGGEANSTTFWLRHTTTYQQPSTGDASSSTYSANIGHYTPLAANLAPIVQYIEPANNAYLDQALVNFSVRARDTSGVDNCTLYLNSSGSWQDEDFDDLSGNPVVVSWLKNLADGQYLWNAYCCDDTGLCSWASINRTVYVDTVDPVIVVNSPLDNSLSNSSTITINVTVTDSNLDYVSIYDNATGPWGINETNTSGFSGDYIFTLDLPDGTHQFAIYAIDLAGNYVWSANYTITVDATPISDLTLVSPADNVTTGVTNTIPFQFNVTDNLGIDHCDLLINGSYAATTSSVINGATTTITHTLVNGIYSWQIQCFEVTGRSNTSESRILQVDVVAGGGGGGGGAAPEVSRAVEVAREFLDELVDTQFSKDVRAKNLKILMILVLVYSMWLLFGTKKKKEDKDKVRKRIKVK